MLAVLTSPEYADMSVAQVWVRELDAGRYWCSQRTMHRLLAAAGMNGVAARPGHPSAQGDPGTDSDRAQCRCGAGILRNSVAP